MFKFSTVAFALIACVFAKPSGIVAPLAYSAPLLAAPGFVSATSSQVVARNYNGAIVAAAPAPIAVAAPAHVAYAAPFAKYAAAPLGYSAPLAAPLGYSAQLGAPLGYSAQLGYSAPLGYSTPLGYPAPLAKYASAYTHPYAAQYAVHPYGAQYGHSLNGASSFIL